MRAPYRSYDVENISLVTELIISEHDFRVRIDDQHLLLKGRSRFIRAGDVDVWNVPGFAGPLPFAGPRYLRLESGSHSWNPTARRELDLMTRSSVNL